METPNITLETYVPRKWYGLLLCLLPSYCLIFGSTRKIFGRTG